MFLRESRAKQPAMERPNRADRKATPAKKGCSAEIGFSITNQRGERFCCRSSAVALRIKRGMVQMIEGERGCFVWFEQCQVEVCGGRRNILFHLRTGSASSDGGELTIVAEVARELGGAVAGKRSRCRSPGRTGSGGTEKTKRACNPTHAKAA